MQPKIFVSKNREERDGKIWETLEEAGILKDNPEILTLDDDKIGIAQIKLLIKHLSTKPFGKTPKSAVILNGNNISPDAQNALLKTLEEVPGESVIITGVDAENKLLPTVLSRCLVINLEFKMQNSEFNVSELINKSVEERFEVVEKASDKEQLLNDLTETYRQKALSGEVPSEFLEELLQAQIWKEANVNVRTILEYLMLRLTPE